MAISGSADFEPKCGACQALKVERDEARAQVENLRRTLEERARELCAESEERLKRFKEGLAKDESKP